MIKSTSANSLYTILNNVFTINTNRTVDQLFVRYVIKHTPLINLKKWICIADG